MVTSGVRKDIMIREGFMGYGCEKSVSIIAMFHFLTWMMFIDMFALWSLAYMFSA